MRRTKNVAEALQILSRVIELCSGSIEDMTRNLPERRLPTRPTDSEAHLLRPSLIWTRRDLACALCSSANFYESQKQWSQAVKMDTDAVMVLQSLVKENPEIPDFGDKLEAASLGLIQILEKSGNAPAARLQREQATKFWQELALKNPDNERILKVLGRAILAGPSAVRN